MWITLASDHAGGRRSKSRGEITLRPFAVLVVPILVSVASCEERPAEVPSPPFEEVFELAEVIVLGEGPSDSVAEVGEFFERRDGGFIIADRLLPRVRTYREDGSLEAGFGRFGDGPWEFRTIRGVAEVADGRIAVTGAQNGAVTYLNPDLTPHSMLLIEDFTSSMLLPFGRDLVFTGRARDVNLVAEMDGIFHRLIDSAVTWSSWNTPAASKPYWNALGGLHGAAAGDSVYVMAGLLYPATILSAAGDSVGSIGTPSPDFRRVPELEPGALAFAGGAGAAAQAGTGLKTLIESFDLVTGLDIVDDYLVFTVGRHDPAKPWFPFKQLDVFVEAYDRHTGEKLFENVPLPEGSKVLGGGRYLYVLVNPEFPPWRIARYKLRIP
ncbi:MAG: hypothetical protein F4Z33_06885 [Gemmatimonadales bacterium]|nr:hypothetical protein [Gemmatimonadales bacterium]MYC88890.1 hypothetical protein [Candidatus Palauibacter denitrificans]